MRAPTHHIMFNGSSGTAAASGLSAEQLVARFTELGHVVSIDADQSRPFEERLRTAHNSPATVLVAAGGDGTATALARVAVETGKTLAVLPFGTANLLARDLHLPLTADEWFASYANMVEQQIDVGEVNGRAFLHKVVVGAVPGLAAVREKIRGNFSLRAGLGLVAHFIRRLSRLRRFAVEVTPEGGDPHIHRVHSIAVANNDYDEGLGRFFSRSRLDAGTLSLYMLRSLSVRDAVRLGLEMFVGSWRNDEVLEIENVSGVTIRTRHQRVRAMIDGEIEMVDTPMKFTVRPLALKVLAIPAPEAVTEQMTETTN